jgi:hypothetical protein
MPKRSKIKTKMKIKIRNEIKSKSKRKIRTGFGDSAATSYGHSTGGSAG